MPLSLDASVMCLAACDAGQVELWEAKLQSLGAPTRGEAPQPSGSALPALLLAVVMFCLMCVFDAGECTMRDMPSAWILATAPRPQWALSGQGAPAAGNPILPWLLWSVGRMWHSHCTLFRRSSISC